MSLKLISTKEIGTMITGNSAVEVLDRIRNQLSGVWEREKNVIDVFMDFEFWDRGNIGLRTISGGLVFVSGGFKGVPYQQKRFYFINTDFFEYLRNGFMAITSKYREGDDNAKWLHEHVFKYLHDKVSGKTMQWVQDNIDVETEEYEPTNDPELKDVVQAVGSIGEGDIKEELQKVVDSFGIKSPELRIWGYYPAHDHVCLCSIFGAMVDMPDSWSFYDFDLRSMTDIYGYEHDDFNPEPAQPHHALHDAYSQYLTTRALFERLKQDNVIAFDANIETKF